MKLSERSLEELARMVVGDAKHFPYRSSYYITRFFSRCGLSFIHDGTTRPVWTRERLAELNLGNGQSSDLPSDDLCRVMSELFDAEDFERHNDKLQQRGDTDPEHFADLEQALAAFNQARPAPGAGCLPRRFRALLFTEYRNGRQLGDVLAAIPPSIPTGDRTKTEAGGVPRRSQRRRLHRKGPCSTFSTPGLPTGEPDRA
jgi:hypothetical protein